MRIITGSAKGTKLLTLEGTDTRPTPERVKEAIFSMIQFDIEGRRILDLFSGSGQMGLEALSRGAAKAVLVDSNPQAIKIIKENAQKTKLLSSCQILCSDYSAYLKSVTGKETFDLIYLDPPYALKLVPRLMEKIERANILSPYGRIICETEEPQAPKAPDTFVLEKHLHYGRVTVTIFAKRKEDLS